jgi:hypothetical protein
VKAWVCLMILLPGLAMAESADTFPEEFFVGQYRLVGTSPEGPLDESVRLDSDDGGLAVGLCGLPDAGRLVLPAQSGAEHYIEGRIGTRDVVCDPFMTYENYPLLACYGADGALLTLWPQEDFAAALDCGE